MKDYWAKKKGQGWAGKKAVFPAAGLMADLIYHCLRTGEPPHVYYGRCRISKSLKPLIGTMELGYDTRLAMVE